MIPTTTLTDDALLEQFEAATLPGGLFNHQQHVRVGWLYVTRKGMPEALDAFSNALQRFAAAKGAHKLFHVTMTWAYLFLIHERQQICQAEAWESFAAGHPDLLTWKPSLLDRYYTPETLWSDRARHGFVMPDRIIAP